MSQEKIGDVQAALQYAELSGQMQTMQLDPNRELPLAVILPVGKKIHSIKNLVDEYRTAPESHAGTSLHKTFDSFLSHIARFKDEEKSAIFANADSKNPRLFAIYDYPTKESPSFRRHGAILSLELSNEWNTWRDADDNLMPQDKFAEFIENRVDDIVDTGDLADKSNEGMRNLSADLGYSFASKLKMIELSRGIAINESVKVKRIVSLATGQGEIQYASEHSDENGQKLTIPGLFLIQINLFKNGTPFRIPVRLRYRLKNQELLWGFQLYRPEKAFDLAYSDICDKVVKETGIPLFVGISE